MTNEYNYFVNCISRNESKEVTRNESKEVRKESEIANQKTITDHFKKQPSVLR